LTLLGCWIFWLLLAGEVGQAVKPQRIQVVVVEPEGYPVLSPVFTLPVLQAL